MPYQPLTIGAIQSDGIYFHRREGLWLVSRVMISPEDFTMKQKRSNTWGLATPLKVEVIA